MEQSSLSDEEEDASGANPFIVLDSQQVSAGDDGASKKSNERKKEGEIKISDAHSAILQELEISKVVSCPETPSPLQGRTRSTKPSASATSIEPMKKAESAVEKLESTAESNFTKVKTFSAVCRSEGNPGTSGADKNLSGEEQRPIEEVQHGFETVVEDTNSSDDTSAKHKKDSSCSSRELSFKSSSSTFSSSASQEFVIDKSSLSHSHPQHAALQLVSTIESKSSSSSSIYLETSSSTHHSSDPSNISSSPEFRIPSSAPSHEHEAKESISSSTPLEQQPSSQKSSFDCLQLSGEPRHIPVSEYSLPDPLTPSPSTLSSIERVGTTHLSESDPGLSSNDELKAPKKSSYHSALPKWVKEKPIEAKHIQFHSSSSDNADSAHKSSSSSPATSPTTEQVSPFEKIISEKETQAELSKPSEPDIAGSQPEVASSSQPASQYAIAPPSQPPLDEYYSQDMPDSCVYPIQDSKTCTSPEIIPPTQHQKTAAISISRTKTLGTSSSSVSSAGPPSRIPVGRQQAVSFHGEEGKIKPGESETLEESQSLSAPSETAEDVTKEASSEKFQSTDTSDVPDVEHPVISSPPEASVESQASSDQMQLALALSQNKDERSIQQAQKDYPHEPLVMEIELSQDLFNQPVSSSQQYSSLNRASQLSPLSPKEDASSFSQKSNEDKDEFRLFLSQSQVSSSYARDRGDQAKETDVLGGPVVSEIADTEMPIDNQSQVSLQDPETSRASEDKKSQSASEKQQQQKPTEYMTIPKKLIEKLAQGNSSDSSSSNQLHLSLPAGSQVIRPYLTLTPPSRKRTYDEDFEVEESCAKKEPVAVDDVPKAEDSLEKEVSAEKQRNPPLEPEVVASQDNEEQSFRLKGIDEVTADTSQDTPLIQTDVYEKETIYSKALKTLETAKQKSPVQPTTSKETDPFAFSDKDDEETTPIRKKRKLEKVAVTEQESTTTKPSSVGDSQPEADDTLVQSVVKIVTEVKRKIIQEFRTLDGTLLKEVSFEEHEPPTVGEPTIEIVSLKSLNIDLDVSGGSAAKRKSPSKAGQKPTRASPRLKPKVVASETSPRGSKRSRKAISTSDDTPKPGPSRQFDLPKNDEPTNEKQAEKTAGKSGYEKLVEATLAAETVTRRQTRSFARRSESENEALKVGTRGFGKWRDSCYYPGVIAKKISDKRFKVKFDDGNQLILPTKSFIVCKFLPRGQKLFARDPELDCFCLGTVNNVLRLKNDSGVEYEIKLDHNDSIEQYKTAEIMLNAGQIAELAASLTVTGTEASSEPVEAGSVEHQEAASSCVNMASGQPSKTDENSTKLKKKFTSSSLRQKRAEEFAKFQGSSSQSFDEDFATQRPSKRKKNESTNIRPGILKENVPRARQQDVKSKSNESKESRKQKKEKVAVELEEDSKDPEFIKEYGPLAANKNLFRGYAFIITYIEPKEPATQDEDVKFSTKGFKRQYLKKQIETAGGVVIHSIKHPINHPVDKTILISPTNQRTHKYYYAIASGISCLHHLWIVHCCRDNTLLPAHEYTLPAGEDRITQETVFLPDRTKPLHGRKVVMKVKQDDESEIRTVLLAAGCEILQEFPRTNIRSHGYENTEEVEPFCFILVSHSIKLTASFRDKAERLGIPCVTMEWLAQCIVRGFCFPPSSHHSFLYSPP